MNYDKACKILNINKDADLSEIKKKYRIQALRYHPDKCKLANANEIFLEVNEAYNYLMNNKSRPKETRYSNILEEFLKENLEDFEYATIILKIINKSFIPYFIDNCDVNNLTKIYEFVKEYKDLFDIDESIIKLIKKKVNMVTIILNPDIDDLLDSNVFILNYKGSKLSVPLWHNEIYYDIKDEFILVKCIPELSSNIIIDLSNNIHILMDKETEKNDIILGKKMYNLDNLVLNKDNKLILHRKGIKCIEEDLFRDNKMDIIIHFN